MFNEELKLRYIKDKERSAIMSNGYLTSQFTHLEEYETELNKDAANFTAYEITTYYKMRNFTSLEQLTVLNSQLSMYAEWYRHNAVSIDNQNHYLEFTLDSLNKCINKLILQKQLVDRKTVLSWVIELPNPRDQFILLALFEFGKSKNFVDIVNAKLSDINENIFRLQDGREVYISNELKRIAKESVEEKVYYSVSGKGVKTMPLRADDDKIVKQYPNVKVDSSDFQKGRVIYHSITRSLKYIGIDAWCSANSIVESGKLYMIKKRAEELDITPMEYVYSNNVQEIQNQYGCNFVRSVYSKKYQEYLE